MAEGPKTPFLLVRLNEMVEDDKIFDLQRVQNPEQFKQQCRQIFAHLYENTASSWNKMIQHADDATPEFPGSALFGRFDILGSHWINAFATSIRLVARQADLPDKAHRDFLYFMLGGLFCGWQEYLRQQPWTMAEEELQAAGAGASHPGDDAAPGTPGTGENICPACQGTGKSDGETCPNCGGTGKVTEGIGGA